MASRPSGHVPGPAKSHETLPDPSSYEGRPDSGTIIAAHEASIRSSQQIFLRTGMMGRLAWGTAERTVSTRLFCTRSRRGFVDWSISSGPSQSSGQIDEIPGLDNLLSQHEQEHRETSHETKKDIAPAPYLPYSPPASPEMGKEASALSSLTRRLGSVSFGAPHTISRRAKGTRMPGRMPPLICNIFIRVRRKPRGRGLRASLTVA